MKVRISSTLSFFACCLFLITSLPAFATEPVAIIDSYIAGWNSHDPAKCAASFDENIEFYDATVGKPAKGKADVTKAVVQNFMKAVPNLKLERTSDLVVQGDRLAYEWAFSGINTGSWSDGTPATNKPFRIEGVSMVRLKDGKIVYSGDYYDAYGFFKQLGLLQ